MCLNLWHPSSIKYYQSFNLVSQLFQANADGDVVVDKKKNIITMKNCWNTLATPCKDKTLK